LDYRYAGRQRRLTIGRWPEWSVTAARERARELRRMIDEGEDALAAKEELREAPRVTEMIERYIKEHLPKLSPTNAGDQISMLRKMVEPAWGRQLVTYITKSDFGPAPVLFRSFESDTRHQGDRIWQRYTATSSSGMRFALRSPVA
jgi:hypothetical protein